MWRRNLIPILLSYRYELLPPPPPLLSPQEPPAQSVLPALRLFQLRAPHSLASGAQRSCTDHSACAQGAPHSRRCSTYRCHCPPSCRRQLRIFHSFSSRSCNLQRSDLSSAIVAVTIELVVEFPVFPLPAVCRDGALRCRQCLRVLLLPDKSVVLIFYKTLNLSPVKTSRVVL